MSKSNRDNGNATALRDSDESLRTIWSILIAATLITASLFIPSSNAQSITSTLLHDFEDGTTMGWGGNTNGTVTNEASGGPDGVNDGYLETRVEEFHLGAKNTGDWSGDYLAAGMQAIEMDLNHFPVVSGGPPATDDPYLGPVPQADNDPDIQIRILIFGPGGTFASRGRTPVLATNEWSHHRFGLTADDLVHVQGGTGVLDDTLRNVTTLLIRNDTDTPTPPKEHPPHVTAALGIDNIQAISVTPTSTGICDTFDVTASALPIETQLQLANPGSNTNQRSFIRFVNDNDQATSVEVYGIDDMGHYSGTIDFALSANASKQLTAQDFEAGNVSKGLNGNFCDGIGKWQLKVFSDNPVRLMGLVRTSDGFLTSLNDIVPIVGDDNRIYFANPASNVNQQTFMRVVNLTDSEGTVTISGIDDTGTVSPGNVSFSLGANQSKQLTAQDLENGNTGKGLTGILGDGTGKWRFTVASPLDLQVMSLIRSQDGFLTNLSGVVEEDASGDHVIYFANPASDSFQQTFLRIINTSTGSGTVTISAIDDNGAIAPSGGVSLSLGPFEAKQMTSSDLENGNMGKGLSGVLGDGDGRWRLTVNSTLDLEVMSLVRTPDGFLTNLSRTAPTSSDVNDVFIFNPASNVSQRSSLRIVNTANNQGSVTISGVDDDGVAAPGGNVTFNIPALSAMSITAEDLENGSPTLVGSLGNGTGKWRLQVQCDRDLKVQSLLDTPTGFLTNLSRTSE